MKYSAFVNFVLIAIVVIIASSIITSTGSFPQWTFFRSSRQRAAELAAQKALKSGRPFGRTTTTEEPDAFIQEPEHAELKQAREVELTTTSPLVFGFWKFRPSDLTQKMRNPLQGKRLYAFGIGKRDYATRRVISGYKRSPSVEEQNNPYHPVPRSVAFKHRQLNGGIGGGVEGFGGNVGVAQRYASRMKKRIIPAGSLILFTLKRLTRVMQHNFQDTARRLRTVRG